MTTVEHARVWQAERPRLTALAYRMLGSWHDAEDVVAQAWTRLADQEGLERPQAWLTTVVTRLAIDAGRRARARRETYVGPWLPEPVATGLLPDEVAERGSMLGLAMLRLLDELEPEDRAVYVLREAFDVPYDEIAACVGRSAAACRQVVSRAGRRLRGSVGAQAAGRSPDERRLVTALVAAVSSGEVGEVVRLISEDCVLWADGGGVVSASRRPVVGRNRVVRLLLGVARRPLHEVTELDVNGSLAVLFRTDTGAYLYVLEHDEGRVTGIQVHANPDKLARVGSPAQ